MSAILITGARALVAVDLARSFEAAGWTPHLADSIRPWLARSHMATTGRLHRFASPRFDFPAFRRDLDSLVERLDPERIVPTCEEVFYVAEAARRGGYAQRVLAPSPELLRRLHSKAEFPHLAQDAGAAAPATRRLTAPEHVAALADEARSLAFKPEFSRFASHVVLRPTPRALRRVRPTEAEPWVAQAFVEGEEVCIWSAALAGRLVAFAAYRPRWRLGRSSSFYFEADDDPALEAMAARLAAETGATGQLSYDVIRRSDGIVAPVECNPRAVSGLHLFDADPSLARTLMGVGAEVARPAAGARHIGAAMALIGAPQALAQRRWSQWRADVARSRDVLGRGAATALLDAARFAAVGLSRGRSASGQSTDDIEWNGEPLP